MSQTEKIKPAVERSTKALSLKPSVGIDTGISKTKIKNADQHSPYLYIFAGAQKCKREVETISPKPQV
jgi:hypothetical protein